MDVNAELLPDEPNADRKPGRSLLLIIGVLTVILAVLTVWTVPRPTGDLYVALAAGRDILNGKLGELDDWCFTTEGRVWVNQNWGTHLLYYTFYRLAGGNDGSTPIEQDPGEVGLVLLKLLILVTGTVFLILACRRRGAGWPVALLVTGGVIAAGRSFIDLRPNLTTLMFVPVMLHLLYRTLEKPGRIWLVMIVFGVIWANLHGGFFLGLVTMGFWSLCMVVPAVLRERALGKLSIGLVWGAAAGLLMWVLLEAGELVKTNVSVPLAIGAGLVVSAGFIAVQLMRERPGEKDQPRAAADALARALGEGRWKFLAATVGAFVLAGVVTPFGIQHLWRDYESLKMSFSEIWNLTHPFVVMAGADSDQWQNVIEWHSIFIASARTFGTSWEFFGIVGLFAALVPLRIGLKLARSRRINPEDVILLLGVIVLAVVVLARAVPVHREFGRWVEHYGKNPQTQRELAGVQTQIAGWRAAMIVYPGLGAAALGVLIAAIVRIFSEKGLFKWFGAQRVGLMFFEIALAAGGIHLAFGARRFIPLSLILLAPLLARWVDALLTSELKPLWRWVPQWSVPAAAGVAIFVTISFQTWHNALRYWPDSPMVRHDSMLKNMIVYEMFPPGSRDFILANDLNGRAFNEWRWEGYLRWYCPGVKTFVGGRAQQVHHIDNYKMQQALMKGPKSPGGESPAALEREKILWIIVPLNTASYTNLIQAAAYDDGANWPPIYCDGENIILANSRQPESLRMINACAKGLLKYPDKAIAALSKSYFYRWGRARNFPAAIAAAKAAQKIRPIFEAYSSTSPLYRFVSVNRKSEIAYYEAENKRLAAMDYNRRWGIQILQSRKWVLGTLEVLYKGEKDLNRAQWARQESKKIDDIFAELVAKWR